MLSDPRPYFADIDDPRRANRNKLHNLHDILMIVLCAVLSGVEDWVGMEVFAQEKADWLRQFIGLENGIPSHDTLSDVMGRIDYTAFSVAFMNWVQGALPSLADEHIAVDGKTLRGSREQGRSTVHLVSAFAAKARLVLAQQAVCEKSNEIIAIPDVLSLLELKGAVVSIDAMGCQKDIAALIVEKDADYVLALKDNHPTLADDVGLWLDTEYAANRLTVHETLDKGHGRLEERRYVLSDDIDWLSSKVDWKGLSAVGMVESVRHIKGKTSIERRYYLCSFNDLQKFSNTVRNHWSIENQQHWLLDVQFGEDNNRSRKEHSAKNLATVRRMALNIIRHNDPHNKRSLRQRQNMAAFNDNYRLRLIMGDSKI
jgi:predicted transposase YbfD/YdcC